MHHDHYVLISLFPKWLRNIVLIGGALFLLFNPVTIGVMLALLDHFVNPNIGRHVLGIPKPQEPYETVIRGTEKWMRTCSDDEVRILSEEQVQKFCWDKTYATDYEQKQDALTKAKAAIRIKRHDQWVQEMLANGNAADKQQAEALAWRIEENLKQSRAWHERCHVTPDSPELAAARLENNGHRIFDPKIPADRKLIYEMDSKKSWCD